MVVTEKPGNGNVAALSFWRTASMSLIVALVSIAGSVGYFQATAVSRSDVAQIVKVESPYAADRAYIQGRLDELVNRSTDNQLDVARLETLLMEIQRRLDSLEKGRNTP